MSTFGTVFRVTTFGESHCKGVGAVVDGVPAGLPLVEADIQLQLTRRRPGQSALTTPRAEVDAVTILSGTERGVTLGTPIALFVPNEDQRPGDYASMARIPRPGHADFTYLAKYGVTASSGGGRSSARETIGRVAAGAIAEKWLAATYGVSIVCFVCKVGSVELPRGRYRGPGGRPWSREEVDCLGTLSLLRDPRLPPGADEEAAFLAVYRGSSADLRAQVASGGADAAVLGAAASSTEGSASTNGSNSEAYGPVALVRRSAAGEAPQTPEAPTPVVLPFPAYRDAEGRLWTMHGEAVVVPSGWEWPTDVNPASSSAVSSSVAVRCPDPSTAARMASLIRCVKADKDSTGGWLAATVSGVPVGLGEPVFDKLEARLAAAMLSLPATKGFEMGSGFEGAGWRGSVHNDVFVAPESSSGGGSASSSSLSPRPVAALRTATNNAGGTLGGITSGADLEFKVAIKPVSTIGLPQATVDVDGNPVVLEAKGRHDPCVLPRAPPLVEGMTALVLADAALLQRARAGPGPVVTGDVRLAGVKRPREEGAGEDVAAAAAADEAGAV